MPEIKICKYCGKEKDLKDFCRSGGAIKNICKECQNKRQTKIYRDSKKVPNLEKEINRLNGLLFEIDSAFTDENIHNNMELVRRIKDILKRWK